ncbi:hypothetical protein BDV59DRAFT_185534 [Aspergillus ambiguus]|uniref:uncharacterized protein n=1 Tax=Aspergillus ambiguus TaxID=176160 RepID=UPI003CCCE8D4
MGWVGVATLIATACYLLYRFPPSTWNTDPVPESTRKPSPPVRPAAAESTGQDATTSSVKCASSKIEDEEDAEESQSTPKASASTAPVLEIPTLNLGNETSAESLSEPPATQTGSASPAASKSTSKSTTPNGVNRTNPSPALMPPPPAPPSQRSGSASSSSLMPPPPPPRLRPPTTQTLQQQQPPSSLLAPPRGYPPRPTSTASTSSTLRPPPSAAATARAPRGGGLAPPTNPLSAKPAATSASKRAVLEPGYSPLDWAALTSNPNNNLRGANVPPHPIRVTPSMLKAQNGRKGSDAWTSYQGKVYNITPYLPFHPGGKGELLRGAGKDSGKLFFEIHPWVNWDAILGECLVGILVSENEPTENALDAMD